MIPDTLEQRVKEALVSHVRPLVQQDGGDIEFIKVEDGTVYIEFKGACIGCPFSFYPLVLGIEQTLKGLIPEISKVVAI
jgi:NFU1 iron-sulfur cluster scaffold homolog, mitochondrial